MKLDEDTRYPYPVLSQDTGDFSSAWFGVEFGIHEDSISNVLSITPRINLEHTLFKALVERKQLTIRAAIHCGHTYFSSMIDLCHEQPIVFEPGQLTERVTIRPLVLANENLDVPVPEDIEPEYGLSRLVYSKGSIVGWAELHVIHVGKRKLAPIESIFELARNDEMEDGAVKVDPSGNKIRICAARETFEHIDLMRRMADKQAVIINSIYLPAVMSVLDAIRQDSNFGDYDWYPTFIAKCEFLQINIRNSDLMEAAQKILKLPYKKIQAAFSE